MSNKLKKFSGVSILTSGVILMSGCGNVVGKNSEICNTDKNASFVTTNIDDLEIVTEPTTISVCTTMPSQTTTVTTTSTVISTTTTEPFAYAGYGYRDYLKSQEEEKIQDETEPFAYAGSGYRDYLDELNNSYSFSDDYNTDSYRYRYVDGYRDYLVQEGDTIDSLSKKFNITSDQLLECNLSIIDDETLLFTGVVRYPVKYELYQLSGESIDDVSINSCVSKQDLIELNPLDENGSFGNVSEVVTHVFVGNENSYRDYNGSLVNCVYNNRVYGDIIYGGGFAGASQYVLAKVDNPYFYGHNDVVLYNFDGNNNINYAKVVCSNAKDISFSNDEFFNISLRDEQDIIDMFTDMDISIDSVYNIDQYASRNFNSEYVKYDDFGKMYLSVQPYNLGFQKVK